MHNKNAHLYVFLTILTFTFIVTKRANLLASSLSGNIFTIYLMHMGEQTNGQGGDTFSIPLFITNGDRTDNDNKLIIEPPILNWLWDQSQRNFQEYPRWHMVEGRYFLLTGDIENASNAFEYALSTMDNQNELARFYLGLSYEIAGDHEKAVQTWYQMPQIGHYFLVSGREQLNLTPEVALKFLRYAANISPQSCEIIYYHGNVFLQLNQIQNALAAWAYPDKLTCTGDHFLGEIYFQRGELMQRLGLRDEAINEFRLAVSADSANVKTLVRLANLLTDAGNVTEAETLYTQIRELDPDELWGYLGSCNLARVQQDYALALTFCQQALQQSPHNSTIYYYTGLIYQEGGDLPAAINWYRKIDDKDIVTAQMGIQLGDAYLESGEIDDAINAYEIVLRIDPGNEHAFQRLESLHE